MYTRELNYHYKCKCNRCKSWVNETDRYCPMCGYKAVEDYNPKFDDFSDEQYTQRMIPASYINMSDNKEIKVELNFIIPDIKYEFSISTKESKLYIGTSPNCAIVVKRKFVSRFHAMLTYDFNTKKLYISDNNSTNGTYVNGKKLSSGELFEINPEDKINLSDSFLLIYKGYDFKN